jgi:hypothetical protein
MPARCSHCDGPWVTSYGETNEGIGNGVCGSCYGERESRGECRACAGTGRCRACRGLGRIKAAAQDAGPRAHLAS